MPMGRRLYRLVETRSYRYNYTGPTIAEGPNAFRSLRKRMGQTAHVNATHDLTDGIIADSFRRNPSLRRGGKYWAD
jgi:hypothetical protein